MAVVALTEGEDIVFYLCNSKETSLNNLVACEAAMRKHRSCSARDDFSATDHLDDTRMIGSFHPHLHMPVFDYVVVEVHVFREVSHRSIWDLSIFKLLCQFLP